eukprot:26318-Eustigmatos_ZCMA.PRE.1
MHTTHRHRVLTTRTQAALHCDPAVERRNETCLRRTPGADTMAVGAGLATSNPTLKGMWESSSNV